MLNWVVVGVGDIAVNRVIPAIQAEERSSLYGVVTRNPDKAEPFGCKAWTNLDEALADEAVNAVYVATPVVYHAAQSIAALKAGKDVLCEKPVSMNLAEGERMVQVQEETGRKLGIAYYRRLYPKVERARQLISQGAIGRPLLAEISCGEYFNAPDGFRSWLLDPEMAGGGPLYDIGSHRIDLINYLFGRPVRATGQVSNVVNDNNVEDCATVLVEYDSGVRGIVDVRWNSQVGRDGFRILGTEGELDLTPLNGPTLVHPGGIEEIPAHQNVHFPCVKNFVDHVLDGTPLAAPAHRAIRTDWVTEQVMRTHADTRYVYTR
jgi:predicted dehydrogenase